MFESDDVDDFIFQLNYSDTTVEERLCQDNKTEEKNVKISNQNSEHSEHIVTIKSCETYPKNSTLLQENISFMTNNLDGHNTMEVSKCIKEEEDEKNRQLCRSSSENKKRILQSLFNHQNKRKFPGPAGLLTDPRDMRCDEIPIGDISSQDIACSQEYLPPSVFQLNLWKTLLSDLNVLGVKELDSINCIKQQETANRLCSRKANTIAAFIESIDISVNPLIILRDSSGVIKCTLHKDAWFSFAPYIMSEHCALALWKPTVLTTGKASNKHYLSITLSNIIAIYCSKNIKDSQNQPLLPRGYSKRISDDFTAITLDVIEFDSDPLENKSCHRGDDTEDHLEGLDSVSFVDDVF